MLKQNDALDGEVARAMTRATLSFASYVTPTPLGSVRIYRLQFNVPGESTPLPVSAYVTGRLFLASTPLRVVEGPSTWRELVDLLSEMPSVRVVSPSPGSEGGDVVWLETSSVLPEPGNWNSSAPVSFPLHVLVTAYQALAARLPRAFARADDAGSRVPLIELGDAVPIGEAAWDHAASHSDGKAAT